jgi:glycosyltransferase involved in cell wall biosynthesis
VSLHRALVLELTALQSTEHAGRGVGRYVLEYTLAVLQRAPGAVERLLLDPEGPWPGTLDPLLGQGLLAWQRPDGSVGAPEGDKPFAYHLTSPFEAVPLTVQWPPYARSNRALTVATVYDLIPLLFPAQYLSNPERRARYLGRLGLVGRADLILTISQATADDVVRELRRDPGTVVNIGTGVGGEFVPPEAEPQPLTELKDAVPGLRPGFLFCASGADYRKNLEGLFAAYGELPASLRAAHQLVITCRLVPAQRAYYESVAARCGITRDLLLTGEVSDRTLRALYQAARLFVFPSLYEGFGLPLAEALRCGTPSIAADRASMREIVTDPAHRFDPSLPRDMADRILEGLRDGPFRRELQEVARASVNRFRWDGVAERALDAVETGLTRHRRILSVVRAPRGRRPRLALVTPFPPERSGVADYSAALLPELCRHVDVDVFCGPAVRRPVDLPPGARLISQAALVLRHGLDSYDSFLYCMGNSPFHFDIYDLLQRLPGTVLAHDVRLVDFFSGYAVARRKPLSFFTDLIAALHPLVPAEITGKGFLTTEEQHRHGAFLTAPVVRTAQRFLVHSLYSAEVAALQVPAEAHKVAVVPFGVARRTRRHAPRSQPVLGTFGIAAPIKRLDLLLEALALVARTVPAVRLLVVGFTPDAYEQELRCLATRLGVADLVTFLGRVEPERYAELLAGVTGAVQLRSHSNGETSAAVADCLSLGVPTVVSALGSGLEYPDGAVLKLPATAGPHELATLLRRLLTDADLRARLTDGALAFAEASDFSHVARELLAQVLPAAVAS